MLLQSQSKYSLLVLDCLALIDGANIDIVDGPTLKMIKEGGREARETFCEPEVRHQAAKLTVKATLVGGKLRVHHKVEPAYGSSVTPTPGWVEGSIKGKIEDHIGLGLALAEVGVLAWDVAVRPVAEVERLSAPVTAVKAPVVTLSVPASPVAEAEFRHAEPNVDAAVEKAAAAVHEELLAADLRKERERPRRKTSGKVDRRKRDTFVEDDGDDHKPAEEHDYTGTVSTGGTFGTPLNF